MADGVLPDQVFDPHLRYHGGFETNRPDGLSQERCLLCARLDQDQLAVPSQDPQRNRRGAAATAQVEPAGILRGGPGVKIARCYKCLNEESINRFSRRDRAKIERGEPFIETVRNVGYRFVEPPQAANEGARR